MKRLIRKASSNPLINALERMDNLKSIEDSLSKIFHDLANDVVEVDGDEFDGDLTDLQQEVEKYIREDHNYIIEHLDIPDNIVDIVNRLSDSQVVEFNEYVIDKFDSLLGSAVEDATL